MDDASTWLGFAPAQRQMQIVQKPAEKVDRIGLVEEVEAFFGLARDLLKELVRRDVGFEGARVPDLAHEYGEALEEGGGGGEVFEHEEVAEGGNVG